MTRRNQHTSSTVAKLIANSEIAAAILVAGGMWYAGHLGFGLITAAVFILLSGQWLYGRKFFSTPWLGMSSRHRFSVVGFYGCAFIGVVLYAIRVAT